MSKKLSLLSLHTTFQECASSTNELISNGYFERLNVQEETLTDLNLVNISKSHKDYVLTRKFSRREEGARSGADWLWCIGEPGAWLSLLVQAKIVNPATSNCLSLNYRSGKQRRLLVDYSRRHRLLPLYCIYSHVSEAFHPQSKSIPALSETDSSEWACSFITPKSVRTLVRQNYKNQKNLLRHAVPWTFPFHYAASNNQQQLAQNLAEALETTRTELDDIDSLGRYIVPQRKIVKSAKRKSWENPNPLTLVTSDLPNVALRLLSGKVRATQSPIAGVSIVSRIPIVVALQGQRKTSNMKAAPKALPISSSMIFPSDRRTEKEDGDRLSSML